MLARLQRLLVVVAIALALGGGLWWAASGRWLVALLWVLGVAAVHPAILALEFVLLHRVNRREPQPRADAPALLRAWWAEVRTATAVFGWRQPWRPNAVPDHLPADGAGRVGLVLVHGFVCNRGLWTPWMQRLTSLGVPFIAVDLEPVFGSIDRYPERIERAVVRITGLTGRPPVIVGHSMGGLAVRAWLAGSEPGRVAHLVTVASPHRGTWIAERAFVSNGREMGLRARWLIDLADRERQRAKVPTTCFYSNADNIVMPTSTATLPGADNRLLPGRAHVDLLFDPRVFDHVLAIVRSVEAGTAR